MQLTAHNEDRLYATYLLINAFNENTYHVVLIQIGELNKKNDISQRKKPDFRIGYIP